MQSNDINNLNDNAHHHYGVSTVYESNVTKTETGWRYDQKVARGSGFIKVPRVVAQRVASGEPVGMIVEDAIVAGMILRAWELRGKSPTLHDLRARLGRSPERIKRSCKRLQDAGWITATKVRFARGSGPWKTREWAKRWQYDIPETSPLRQMERGKVSETRVWVPVPLDVARSKSAETAAAYLVLHEQMTIDKAIVTSTRDLARLLRVSPSTAHEIMQRLGAHIVARQGNRVVYAMDTPLSRRGSRTVLVQGEELTFSGDRDRLTDRHRQLRAAIPGADKAERAALEQIHAHGIENPSLNLFLKVLEELNLHHIVRRDTGLRSVSRSWSWRLRGLARSLRVEKRRQRRAGDAKFAAVASHTLKNADCDKCDGTRLVEIALGSDRYAPCECVLRE